MKRFISAMLLASAVASVPAIVAAGPTEDAITARKAVMQIYKFNLGKLGAMAKGEMEFDAEAAQGFADNLNATATMKNGAMWPQGSGNDNTGLDGVKTRALPAIWATYPAVAEKGKAMKEAAAAMAAAAGSLDGIRGAIGAVGKACKGCHTDFRAEQ